MRRRFWQVALAIAIGMGMTVRPAAEERESLTFLGRVEAFARHYDRPVAQILGHVMAHEMGHLLLPTVSHSKGGIMVANWNRAQLEQLDRGWLTFTHEEVDDIRRSVRTLEARR